MLPEFLRPARHKSIWLTSTLLSLAFLAWFAATVDADTLIETVRSAGGPVLGATLVFLTLNGLSDALWLALMAQRRHVLGGAFRVVAWHMLVSSILPARLGDIAWIYFMHRWLHLPGGRAAFIALYHRLQDFLVMSMAFLLAILAVGFDVLGANFGIAAAAGFGLMGLLVVYLEGALTVAGLVLQRLHRTVASRLTRLLLRQLLQVRMWYRHMLPRRLIWLSFAIIALRWLMTIAGLGIFIHAVAGELAWPDSLFLTNAYIFLGIVPLQAIGGFGASEAGLAWLLVLYGLSVGRASTIGLMVRLLLNIVHIGLWIATLAVLKLRDATAARS